MLDSPKMPGGWGVGAVCCRRRNGLTPGGTKAIIASAPLGEAWRDIKLDDKLHSMLRDLRRALSEAISESSEINRTLRKIREEGYALYLLVDCKREIEDSEAVALTAPRWPTSGEPAFQIDGRDLNFLKSIGIDPTRRLRRRRVS